MVFEIFPDATTINILGNHVSVASLIIGILVMAVGVIVAKIISVLFKKYLATNLPSNVSSNLHKLIYYGIIVITLLAVVTSQGIDLSGLMVAGGIFGIVIGFAAQSVVSNLFSGIFLMFDRPAKTGDIIEIPQSNI
ncbi:MAG TPA: mechanosensitive ion channel domain-containing protein, partial [Candidatus Nitrosotenuis sp.]|nr:mechanosensitive ion channel domain-containing protein [Candidatus Nitrosotenuis sp.]